MDRLSKIDVNSKNPYLAPLLLAAQYNDTVLCKKLIDMKANCDIFNNSQQSPLGYAIKFLNTDLVTLYLENGCNLNNKEVMWFGKSFLYDAAIKALSLSNYPWTGCTKEAIDIIELLIKAGANIKEAIQKAEATHRSFFYEYTDYKQKKTKDNRTSKDQFTEFYYLFRNVGGCVHITQEFIYKSQEFKANIIKLLKQYQKEIPSGQQKLDLVEKLRRFKLKGILQDLQERLAQEENSDEKNEWQIANYKQSIKKIKKELEENIDLCLQETLAQLEELKLARSEQMNVVQSAKMKLSELERELLLELQKKVAQWVNESERKPSKRLPSYRLCSYNGKIFHREQKRLNRLEALIQLEESKAEEYKRIAMLKAQERKNKREIAALKAQQKEDPEKERGIATRKAKKEDKIRANLAMQKKATKAENNTNIIESRTCQLSKEILAQLKQEKENDHFSHSCSIM